MNVRVWSPQCIFTCLHRLSMEEDALTCVSWLGENKSFRLWRKGFDHQLYLCETDEYLLVFGALPPHFTTWELLWGSPLARVTLTDRSRHMDQQCKGRADKLPSSIKRGLFPVSQLLPFFIKALRISPRRSGRSSTVWVHRHTFQKMKHYVLKSSSFNANVNVTSGVLYVMNPDCAAEIQGSEMKLSQSFLRLQKDNLQQFTISN